MEVSEVVEVLEAFGVLAMKADDFGELTVRLDSTHVRFDAVSVFGSGIQAFRCASPEPPLILQKVYHMARLCEEAWVNSSTDSP